MNKLENEQAILGMIFNDSSLTFQYHLDVNDFESIEHQILFQAVNDLIDKKIKLDVMSTITYLTEKNLYNSLHDPVSYLTQLIGQIYTTANFKFHYDILKKNRKVRDLEKLGNEIVKIVNKEKVNEIKVIEAINKRLLEISSTNLKNYSDLKEIDKDVNRKLLEKLQNKVNYSGLSTGYKTINKVIGGFISSQVVILAARPGIGKTSLALNLALSTAKINKENIIIFSLEMSSQELYNRMLSNESKIDMYKYKYGKLDDNELVKNNDSRKKITDLNIFINDNSLMKVSDIKNDCYRLERENGKVGLVIIDYLQLIEPGYRAESKYAQTTQISRELKQLAKDLNVCVLALSQLSREVESRKNKKPQLSDLRDSGAIEQDADIVGLLSVEEVESSDNTDMLNLDIAKNRHGRTGEISLFFHKPTNQFYE